MPPSRQRNLILILLAVGSLVLVIVVVIALTRPQRDIAIEEQAAERPATGSFTFFDLDRTTVLTRRLRSTLSETLGPDAIAHSTPIDLTVVDPKFFKSHLPELHQLNQQLNPPLGARREHDTTRLTYHRAQRRNLPFRYIELVFSNPSGLPLYFIINPSEDFEANIKTLGSKYGAPQTLNIDQKTAPVLIWQKEGDVLVATAFPRRSGRKSQELRIYFVNNLKQFIENEAHDHRQPDHFKRAF